MYRLHDDPNARVADLDLLLQDLLDLCQTPLVLGLVLAGVLLKGIPGATEQCSMFRYGFYINSLVSREVGCGPVKQGHVQLVDGLGMGSGQ